QQLPARHEIDRGETLHSRPYRCRQGKEHSPKWANYTIRERLGQNREWLWIPAWVPFDETLRNHVEIRRRSSQADSFLESSQASEMRRNIVGANEGGIAAQIQR